MGALSTKYRTYVPATGQIFSLKDVESLPDRSNVQLEGLAPPMNAWTAGGIRASDVSVLDGENLVPASKILKQYNTQRIDRTASSEIDRCHKTMLLPALLESATYPSLHWAFSEVPLTYTGSRHLLPDGCGHSGPLDAVNTQFEAGPERYARFDAGKYRTYIPEPIGNFYVAPACPDVAKLRSILDARKARHEQDALAALESIEQEVLMNDIDRQEDDKTAAAKLGEIIRATRLEYGSRMTHMVMGSRMYRRYLDDSNIDGSPVPGSSAGTPGIGPLPGLEYVTVIISPMMDTRGRDLIYALDRHGGALYGQGPMILDTHEEGGGGTGITEYYQYMIVDNNVKHEYGDDVKRRTALRIDIP